MHRKKQRNTNHEPSGAQDDMTRQCIVTREALPKDALIRFCLSPDRIVTPDLSCKLPGRGLWVKAELSIVAQAAVKGVFSRAAKTQVVVPADLAAQVEKQLRLRALQALSMARKAGLLVAGYEKIRKVLQQHEAIALIHAQEAAEDGMAGLNAKAQAVEIIHCFTKSELNQVCARDNAVHVALTAGQASEFFLLHYRRFTGFS